MNPRGESGLQIFIRNIQRFIEQRGGQGEHFLEESKQAEQSSVQALIMEFIICFIFFSNTLDIKGEIKCKI